MIEVVYKAKPSLPAMHARVLTHLGLFTGYGDDPIEAIASALRSAVLSMEVAKLGTQSTQGGEA